MDFIQPMSQTLTVTYELFASIWGSYYISFDYFLLMTVQYYKLHACSNKKIHLVMHLKQSSVLSNYIAFECVDINVL